MKTVVGIREIVEIVGVVSIVVSLIFVGLQMRQEQDLFISGNAINILETVIELNNAIIEHPDVWLSGNKGDPLSDEEFITYERMINSLNEATFQRFNSGQRAGTEGGGIPAIAEFADFLSNNPGAYKVWNDREVRVGQAFRKLLPQNLIQSDNIGVRYRNLVMESVKVLQSP